MLKTRDYVMYELRSYALPKSKLTQMIKKGEIIQIVRTVYADSLSAPKLAAASMIHSPCYISFETALAYHQMIPERVFEVKSAGFQLKKEKHFDTPLGRYSFLYIPEAVFPWAVEPAEVVLQILSQTDFFQHAAFYGGTALRIFYGLNRFSEDMDFSLQSLEPDFSLQKYLPVLEQGLHSFGFTMQAQEKQKQQGAPVQSAFPKGNTRMHLLHIAALPFPYSGVPSNALLSIKVEIDTNPPPGAQYETKFRLLPQPYSVVLYDKPSLFAGKLHALLCRNWKHRGKGRDFYDYVWYLQEHIPVNLEHLQARMHQSGHWDSERSLSLPIVIDLLEQRFTEVDYESVKADVHPFIPNANVLDIWSKEFFIAITKDLLTANA